MAGRSSDKTHLRIVCGYDRPSELWWRSTGRSSEGGRKRELDTKLGPSQRPIVVYQWYTDMELRCYRFGFHIQCRSSVGGLPSPQNFQKTPEFSRRKAEAQYPSEAKANVSNWRRPKLEETVGGGGEQRGESV